MVWVNSLGFLGYHLTIPFIRGPWECKPPINPISWGFSGWKSKTLRYQQRVYYPGTSLVAKLVVSTHLKNISQNGSLPQVGLKIRNIWNQHLDIYIFQKSMCQVVLWLSSREGKGLWGQKEKISFANLAYPLPSRHVWVDFPMSFLVGCVSSLEGIQNSTLICEDGWFFGAKPTVNTVDGKFITT